MCDCYSHQCDGCEEKWIEIHIADFAYPRASLKVYCPECVRTLIGEKYSSAEFVGEVVMVALVEDMDQVTKLVETKTGKPSWKSACKKGDPVVIVLHESVTQAPCLGIHLN